MQFTVSFELYIDIGTRYIPHMKTYLSHWNQNRNIAVEVFIYAYLYLIIELSFFV